MLSDLWGTGEDMFVVWARGWFIRELKNMGGEGSFYSLGGVPWQWRTQFWEAKSLLRQSILFNRPGTADGMELLCDRESFQFHNVLHYQ